VSALHAGLAVLEDDAVLEEEFKGGRLVVGERALHAAVVVAILRHSVRFDDRPVGQVLEQRVGRILDAIFLLRACASAERDLSAVEDAVSADVVIGLHHDNRGAMVGGADRGRQAAGARANDDDIGIDVPPGR
jgi:hypothetical protein